MSLRYLGIGLRARVEQPVTTPPRHKRVPACRGACADVTSGAPARWRRSSGPEVALRVCGCRGRAVPGARLEGGLGKGECPRAATATVPVAAGELAASLPDTRLLRAPWRRAPGSAGAEQKRELLQTAGRWDGPGPLPSVTPARRLPGHGEHCDRQERQRGGERWVESKTRTGFPPGGPGCSAPGQSPPRPRGTGQALQRRP